MFVTKGKDQPGVFDTGFNAAESKTVREISSQLSWRIRADNWEEFPKTQKCFTLGETMAHLHDLANTQYVEIQEKIINYSLVK